MDKSLVLCYSLFILIEGGERMKNKDLLATLAAAANLFAALLTMIEKLMR